jgi:hypothetical protein
MIKVTIERPDVRGTITLTMRNDSTDSEDSADLKDLLRFLTEVARAAGFSYVEDMAAMTNVHVTSGTEALSFWHKGIEKCQEKAYKEVVDTLRQEDV